MDVGRADRNRVNDVHIKQTVLEKLLVVGSCGFTIGISAKVVCKRIWWAKVELRRNGRQGGQNVGIQPTRKTVQSAEGFGLENTTSFVSGLHRCFCVHFGHSQAQRKPDSKNRNTKSMNTLSVARALFIILIALMLGAKDWIAWQWRESTADVQIKAAAIGLTVGTLIATHLFKGPIVALFF
jgi:hypothetical protein